MTDWQLWWELKKMDFEISLYVMLAIIAIMIPVCLYKYWTEKK